MRGVNKVILVGNLGRDPEVRYLPSGGAVAQVTVATSESWRDKNTGQPVEQTEWHRVVFYGKLAEIAGEYLKKGSKVYIEGSLHTRKWQDKQTGQDRYAIEIKASQLQMLDGRQDNGDSANHGADDYDNWDQQPAKQPKQQAAPRGNGQQRQAPPPLPDDFVDDIPF